MVDDVEITTQLTDIEECIGGTDILSVVTEGGTGGVTYQWQSSLSDFAAGFTDIVGAVSTTYMPGSSTAGTTYYRVLVTAAGVGCEDLVSDVAEVIITPDALISVAPDTSEICIGGNVERLAHLVEALVQLHINGSIVLDSLGGWTNIGGPIRAFECSPASCRYNFYRAVVDRSTFRM